MLFLKYPDDTDAVMRRLSSSEAKSAGIECAVERIISSVRKRGDSALREFTRRFDNVSLKKSELRIPPSQMKKAWKSLKPEVRTAIELAARRIEKFHARQKFAGYVMRDPTGARLEYRISPLNSVGIYVPGGTAAYPSSLLMCAIPAKLAGVKDIIIVTPPGRDGNINPLTLGTAYFLGLKKVYRIGGAQAIAALAYGTDTIPRVDKVVGPGNIYVTTAKRILFGVIDIDMIAGPSEILIIADSSAPLKYIVADLLSQAEHDAEAVPVLIYVGALDVAAFKKELTRQVRAAQRKAIIRRSLARRGTVLMVRTRKQAVKLANMKAPEHLELLIKKPETLVSQITNAGAIFVGRFTPEPIGDYVAGPNHVLPTAGTARFFSPLSISSFTKATSVMQFTQRGFMKLAPAAIQLAEEEGLPAHANSIKVRLI